MDIFTLTDEDGNLLHPVRQAATFAKYSRSPHSARELVKKTDDLSATRFQQKWIVEFGHNSIAELATLPVAFEGVSIVATKAIEAWQRPGVSEKSTRMQTFDRDSLYVPEGIAPDLLEQLLPLVDQCFDLYQDMLSGQFVEEIMKVQGVDELALYGGMDEFRASRKAFDIARYLLPAGTRTNMGICAYPRDLSSMIAEFLGSPNPELQNIGERLRRATWDLGGPLIRHTDPDEWASRVPTALVDDQMSAPVDTETSLDPEWNGRGKSAAFLTWRGRSESDLFSLFLARYGLSHEDLDKLMQDRPPHHEAPRIFREAQLDFSIYMDYGAFRDLQRHRRMEQFVEPLTPAYGFCVPPGLVDLAPSEVAQRFLTRFDELLVQFAKIKWPWDPRQQMLCQYLVPLAFIVGWHIKMDLQQLYYIVELRTQGSGHPSYRKIAYEMWDEAAREFPALTQWIRPRGPRPTHRQLVRDISIAE